jgi:general stress protein YciG
MKSIVEFATIYTNGRRPAEDATQTALQLSPGQGIRPDSSKPSETQPKRPRGFAAMDRRMVQEIARKGGKAAHSAGTAHEFTSDEARVAGRQGGRATHAKRREALQQVRETPQARENGGGDKAG